MRCPIAGLVWIHCARKPLCDMGTRKPNGIGTRKPNNVARSGLSSWRCGGVAGGRAPLPREWSAPLPQKFSYGRVGRRCGQGDVRSSAFASCRWLALSWSLSQVVSEGVVVECRGVARAERLIPVWRILLCSCARGVREMLLECCCGSRVNNVLWKEVVDGDECE